MMDGFLQLATYLGALYLLYRFAWRRILGRRFLATAPAVFLTLQLLPVIGLIFNADLEDSFHIYWVFVTLTGLGTFILGCWLANRLYRFKASREIDEFRGSPIHDDLRGAGSVFALLVVITASLAVGYLFSSSVGYNTFQVAFDQLQTTGAVDKSEFSALRSGATRDAYVAAGYAAQFTDVILPAAILLLYLRGSMLRRTELKYFALLLALIDISFLTVVGGRKHLVLVGLAVALVLLGITGPLSSRLRKRGLSAFVITIAIVAMFGLTTLLQGRIGTPSNAVDFTSDTIIGIYDRIGGNYSEVQLRLISLLRHEVPVWGGEWLQTLAIALPGPTEGLTFDARLHGLLYGSTQGAAPLNVWGSVFYNFGIVGILIVPLVVGFALQRFTIRHLIRAPRDLSRIVLFFLAGFRLALWRDPYSILLEGGFTLLAFYWFHRTVRSARRSRVSSASPLSAIRDSS